jgi:hypothetical protein
MTVKTGYIVNSPSLVLLQLPAIASIGSLISVVDQGSGGWRITQGENQSIQVGNQLTTVGVTGRVSSTSLGDAIDLLCVANGRWTAIGLNGNLEIA